MGAYLRGGLIRRWGLIQGFMVIQYKQQYYLPIVQNGKFSADA